MVLTLLREIFVLSKLDFGQARKGFHCPHKAASSNSTTDMVKLSPRFFLWSIPAALSAHQLKSGTDVYAPTCRCPVATPKFVLRQITEYWLEVEFASVDQLVRQMGSRT